MSIKDFQRMLARKRELHITVRGRHSGKTYTIPVWFVLKANKVHLLPVSGSETNWYKNILFDPCMTLTVDENHIEVIAKPIGKPNLVKETIEMFKAKYGADQIERWYAKLDVSVEITLPP